jgi:ATP-dependent Lon protease
MLSALTQRAPVAALSMTGEITLLGRVLPVGGIREKVLAAHRAGITRILLPEENRKDLNEIPKEVRAAVKIDFVDEVQQVLKIVFG